MFDRHKADIIYKMIVKFLDALFPECRVQMLNATSDGETTMTGRHADLTPCIARCAEFNVMRKWCATHPNDIIVKLAAESIYGGAYTPEVHSLSIHLRSQNNLIIKIGVNCEKKTDL